VGILPVSIPVFTQLRRPALGTIFAMRREGGCLREQAVTAIVMRSWSYENEAANRRSARDS